MSSFPPLQGSPKQIDWAERIRLDVYSVIASLLAPRAQEEPEVPYLATLEKIVARHVFAKWWIDHRQDKIVHGLLIEELESELNALLYPEEQHVDPTLVIFDLYGTLTNTPFIDGTPLHLLAVRQELIDGLHAEGTHIAVIAKEGGVAFGLATPQEARDNVEQIARLLGAGFCTYTCAHPQAHGDYAHYASKQELSRRPPFPGMLQEAMQFYGTPPEETLYVAIQEEDKQAADAAGCRFSYAGEYFVQYLEEHVPF
jgi:histidinol phosphatase-like enzyme